MCGFLAEFGSEHTLETLRGAADLIQHRGPDETVELSVEPARFIFHRLAIMDLSDRGRQPLQRGDVTVVCNGELYNEPELRAALESVGLGYELDEGGGAFYGPKIDVKIKDSLGRTWQCSTIQCDFNLPERFDLTYTSSDGSPQRPIMVHRAILGSMERFVGVLIEHFGGRFPVWCAPTQVALIPIREEHADYCLELEKRLQEELFRAEAMVAAGHMNKKIKQAQRDQVPFMLIAGEREVADGTVAIRRRGTHEQDVVPFEEFMTLLRRLRDEKSRELS